MLGSNIYDSIEMLPARGRESRAPSPDCKSASCNAQARDPRKEGEKEKDPSVPPPSSRMPPPAMLW